MDDISHCPICRSKLKNQYLEDYFLWFCNKSDTYIQKTCLNLNHSLQLFTNSSNSVDLLKISLTPNFSQYIQIDFVNNISRLEIFSPKSKTRENILIPEALIPDFPDCSVLKDKINSILLFL